MKNAQEIEASIKKRLQKINDYLDLIQNNKPKDPIDQRMFIMTLESYVNVQKENLPLEERPKYQEAQKELEQKMKEAKIKEDRK